VVAFTPWVRDERIITTVHFKRGPREGVDAVAHVQQILEQMFDGGQIEIAGNKFTVTTQSDNGLPERSKVEVFSRADGGLEIVVKREATVHDGPVIQILPISSVLVPTRVTNLQPPSEYNPKGSPYVFILLTYRISQVKALKESGQFNWLTDAGLKKIIDATMASAGVTLAPSKTEDEIERQKDIIEGREHGQPDVREKEDIDHLTANFVMCFDQWDVGGKGVDNTFWVIARDAEVLCEARLLQERWPSVRPYRPFAEAVAIPVSDRYYGISLLELGEGLYDLVKGTFDISFDSGQVANLPFFFYQAQSAFRAETIKLAPGEGYPVPGDPRQVVHFPNIQNRDQSWALNIIGLGFQMFERLMMIGDLQLGRVPTGKASALRTFGTTIALLQQGDVRADQLLLRLFGGIRQIARNFHSMNRYLLPEGKEVRIVGWDGEAAKGYQTISKIEEIDVDMQFDFRPDFLLSNAAVLAQTMQSVMAIVISPLAIQFDVTDQNLIYNLIKDYIKALKLDPKRYTKQPRAELGPAILAEEAIDRFIDGTPVEGMPMEGGQGHLKKLFAFMSDDSFGLLTPPALENFREHLAKIGNIAQQERNAKAAQAFQGQAQQGAVGGGGGVQTTVQEPAAGEGEVVPQ
ncbi:hypothetical protein LCGC14_2187140, partial [marine sediment metagenome]